jgi:ribose-phosphate pyrophosphokinase
LIIIPGPTSTELGLKIADLLKARVMPIEFKRFPDGESYIRFEDYVENEDVAIIQTTGPPQNDNVIQLLFIADNTRDLYAKSIIAVVPYFAYGRQDKRFRSGEVFSAKTIVRLLQICGVNKIITVNAHNPAVLKESGLPVEDLSAISLIAKYFKEKGLKNVFSLSLGKKGLNTAFEANNVLKGTYDYIPTKRDSVTGNVVIEEESLPVKNREVVIFDDIISSGGTMTKAVAWVKKQGARRIYAACVHPLLIGDAKERILKNGAEAIIGTDTVSNSVSVVSVAPLIAEALRKSGV